MGQRLFEKLIIPSASKEISRNIKELECSLPLLQQPATELYNMFKAHCVLYWNN